MKIWSIAHWRTWDIKSKSLSLSFRQRDGLDPSCVLCTIVYNKLLMIIRRCRYQEQDSGREPQRLSTPALALKRAYVPEWHESCTSTCR
jgi:hypothetical protein